MLLTICPQCSAQFKVAPEQLNVRQGRVMCGRCRHVFNAFESLKRVPDADAPDAAIEAEPRASALKSAAASQTTDESPSDRAAGPSSAVLVLSAPPDKRTDMRDLHDLRDLRNIGIENNTVSINSPIADVTDEADEANKASDTLAAIEAMADTMANIAPASVETNNVNDDLAQDAARTSVIANEANQADLSHLIDAADATNATDTTDTTQQATPNIPPDRRSSRPITKFTSFTTANAADEARAFALAETDAQPASADTSANATVPFASSENPLIHGNYQGKTRTWRAWPWLAGLALICLIAQTIYFFRSQIVMQYPQLRPQLVLACNVIGCQIPWGRNLDAIKIETSDLIEPPGKTGRILLTATMVNRAEAKHDFPLLEVRLKDASNSLIASRIFTPNQYLARIPASEEGIAPGAEIYINLQLTLDGKARASGYDLRAFYP